MKNYPTCSLIIATYNWPDALHLCLLSAFRQSIPPTEIIVCDDGSHDNTRQLIDRLRPLCPVPLVHLWQPDEGFQLARIRNKGIKAATADYIIQIDGDIILHRHFVKDQLANARPGVFYSGNRYYISPEESARLLANPTPEIHLPLHLNKNSWRRVRLPILQQIMRRHYHWPDAHFNVTGCNMAFWRQDLLAVNGYDESFTGWGWEDTDLTLRLKHCNIRLAFLRFGAIQFHLHHQESRLNKNTENYHRTMTTLTDKRTHCEQGIIQLVEALAGANTVG